MSRAVKGKRGAHVPWDRDWRCPLGQMRRAPGRCDVMGFPVENAVRPETGGIGGAGNGGFSYPSDR